MGEQAFFACGRPQRAVDTCCDAWTATAGIRPHPNGAIPMTFLRRLLPLAALAAMLASLLLAAGCKPG